VEKILSKKPIAITVLVFVAFMIINDISASLDHSANIINYGMIDNSKTPTPLIYADINFETGNFSQVREFGGITDYPPISNCEIVTDIVREGNYSMRCIQTDPSVIPGTSNRAKAVLSELGNLHLNESYYGFSVFLSPTLSAPSWLQIFEECQYVSRVANWCHIAQLQICNSTDGENHLYIVKSEIAPTDALWMDPNPIPLGQWIDFVIYINISVNGTVMLWQNGILKAEIHYDTTAIGEPPAAYPEFGLYQDAGNPAGNWMVFDRFIAANTFEQANS
jgi:hypothetical protein